MVHLSGGEFILRLALATALCAAVGLERETRDEAAGLRTHTLVGLGAALFTLVSAYGFNAFVKFGNPPYTVDPTRITAQIVNGVGFLGAGAIIRRGLNVRGVTTASSLWIVAAIGMAAGAGYYVGAVATTGLVLVVLIGLLHLRPSLMRAVRSDYVMLRVELEPGARNGPVLGLLAERRISLESLTTSVSKGRERLKIELRLPPHLYFAPVLAEVAALDVVAAASTAGMRRAARAGIRRGMRAARRREK